MEAILKEWEAFARTIGPAALDMSASVLRLWKAQHASPRATDIDDIIRFDEAIDQLLAASVFSFAAARRQAEETERQRRNHFLSMLAHELSNPLSPISMSATILKTAKGNEAVVENASDVISRQVTHMAALVDDLKVRLEAVDVRQVIDDALEQVTPQIQARCHQLTLNRSPEPVFVQADKKRLVQVIANLLTNAAKYTPARGHITLKVVIHGNQVVIAVEDKGIGMAPEFVPHVFELFAQAEQTPDRSSGGLGIGLALVKSLIELHDGKVACTSGGLGQGSQFTVWLPRRHGAAGDVERLCTLLT